jgi:hypothetical protein
VNERERVTSVFGLFQRVCKQKAGQSGTRSHVKVERSIHVEDHTSTASCVHLHSPQCVIVIWRLRNDEEMTPNLDSGFRVRVGKSDL